MCGRCIFSPACTRRGFLSPLVRVLSTACSALAVAVMFNGQSDSHFSSLAALAPRNAILLSKCAIAAYEGGMTRARVRMLPTACNALAQCLVRNIYIYLLSVVCGTLVKRVPWIILTPVPSIGERTAITSILDAKCLLEHMIYGL